MSRRKALPHSEEAECAVELKRPAGATTSFRNRSTPELARRESPEQPI